MKKLTIILMIISGIAVLSSCGTTNSTGGNVKVFRMASNGITIRCPDADVGTAGKVNGVSYTKRTAGQITASNAATTCTSGITDMKGLFKGNTSFNADISSWDVSEVTDMSHMFQGATSFNQNLSAWDFSNVTTASHMFDGANSFNWGIGNESSSRVAGSTPRKVAGQTNVPSGPPCNGQTIFNNLTNMDFMFANNSSFNAPITQCIETSHVTSMKGTFEGAVSFNQPIGDWDVSNVKNMEGMFETSGFDQPIGGWDVSSVTNMSYMFKNDTLRSNLGIGNWKGKVGNVTNMSHMFENSVYFNENISQWDVSSVTDMSSMFRGAVSFNQDIGTWDVGSVTDMDKMFLGAYKFKQDLSGWCVSNVQSHVEFAANTPMPNGYLPQWGSTAPCQSP